MKYAIVSNDTAILFQHYQEGCNMVEFAQLKNGNWAAPFEIYLLLPTAFPEVTFAYLTNQDFINNENI